MVEIERGAAGDERCSTNHGRAPCVHPHACVETPFADGIEQTQIIAAAGIAGPFPEGVPALAVVGRGRTSSSSIVNTPPLSSLRLPVVALTMIIVLGATGYVGSKFIERLQARGLDHLGLSRAQVDYTRPGELRDALRSAAADQPRFLINAAGYTGKPNVDACETDRAACLEGNATFPGRVAEVCAELGLPWGQVSSGCIFQGTRDDGAPFTEDDEPNFSFRRSPCSWYSGTKALGEEVIADAPDCFVWRLRIPFNHEDNPRNYLTKLIRYPRLIDVENTISHLDEFVDTCISCHTEDVAPGVYNLVNPGMVTAREVAALLTEAGLISHEIDWFESMEAFNAAVKTPRSNCELDPAKIGAAGLPMRPVAEALADSIARYRVQQLSFSKA